MLTGRPYEKHIISNLRNLYRFTVDDEELWRNVVEFNPAQMGEGRVLVVKYGFSGSLYIIPVMI